MNLYMQRRMNSDFAFKVCRATAEADNLRNWVKCQAGPCENCGEQSGKMTGNFPHYVSFPCQYHSTNAPYSFIHLLPTLCNVFLPALQFPPVSIIPSFHQCSILIHSSTTNAVYVFLPALQFPLSVSFHQCSILIHSSTTHAV